MAVRFAGWAPAVVAGALPALAFPAPSWWWLAWFGVVPLLLVVRAAPTPWAAAVRAWCGAAGFVLTTQYWLVTSIGPLLAVLAVGLGALWLPWGWFAHRLLSAPVAAGRTVSRAGRVAQRVGGGRSGAVLAVAGWSVGVAGRVAVEPARHAGVGRTGRGVADEFPCGCDQYRHRRRASCTGMCLVDSSRWRVRSRARDSARPGTCWAPRRPAVRRCGWRWCSPAISPMRRPPGGQ